MKANGLLDRHRPARFDRIVGQADAVRALRGFVLVAGSRPAALLMSGPPGVGKTTAARIYGAALACRGRSGPEPCGMCGACQAPDLAGLIEVNAADHRGIDDVRELVDWSRHYSAGEWSTVVLDEAAMLTTEAQSALLKPLEEPGAGVTWILISSESHKLRPGVRSRLTEIRFGSIGELEISGALARIAGEEGWEFDLDRLAMVAKRSDGSLRDAIKNLSLLVHGGGHDHRAELGEPFVSAALQDDFGTCRELIRIATADSMGGRGLFESTVAALFAALDSPPPMGPLVRLKRERITELLHVLGDRGRDLGRGSDAAVLMTTAATIRHVGGAGRPALDGAERPPGPISPASRDGSWRTLGCPTPQSKGRLLIGKDGRAFPARPCGRFICPVCGINAADELRAGLRASKVEVMATVEFERLGEVSAFKKRVDRILSTFGASVHVWYLETTSSGAIRARVWMRRREEASILDRALFAEAVRRQDKGASTDWVEASGMDSVTVDFLSNLRGATATRADARRALGTHCELNGGSLVRGSHGFFLNRSGEPRTKRQLARSSARA